MTRWLNGIWSLLVVVAAIALLNSCSTISQTAFVPPAIPGASFVGNKTCAECHTNICRIFPGSAHARIQLEGGERLGQTGCESCHGPGSLHVSSGGGRDKFIINPGKDPQACFQCHLNTEGEFQLPYHHPVVEHHMNCVQCHDPHGGDIYKPAGGLAQARLNQGCAQCHREQTRPFVFEHEAMREGCIVCHSPHGSINNKMLVQPDNNLCLKCHAQVPGAPGKYYIGKIDHTAFLRQGTCWSAGCHTAIHGSNINPRMLY